jgi:hypothetical protein
MDFVRRMLRALQRSALGIRMPWGPRRRGRTVQRPERRAADVLRTPGAAAAVSRLRPAGPLTAEFTQLLRDIDAFIVRCDDDQLANDFDAFLERSQDDDPGQLAINLTAFADCCRRIANARSRPERTARSEADQRGIALLSENLTAEQRRQFALHRHFDVIGGQSGRRYRVWHCPLQNIEEFDARGNRICVWCFHPREPLVLGDVLLAQKTALELFESDALRIAHRYSDFASSMRPELAAAFIDHRYMLMDSEAQS